MMRKLVDNIIINNMFLRRSQIKIDHNNIETQLYIHVITSVRYVAYMS